MDIKNILNDNDRRLPPKPPTPEMHLPKQQPSPPHYSFHTTPPPPPPPPQPPQQIVYTGPVYQLQPAVQVRHLGPPIHYRYTPYPPPYDDPTLDYPIYPHYPSPPYITQDRDPDRDPPDSDHTSPPPPHPRRRHHQMSDHYHYDVDHATSDASPSSPPPSATTHRRFRTSSSQQFPDDYASSAPPSTRPFRRAGLPATYAHSSSTANPSSQPSRFHRTSPPQFDPDDEPLISSGPKSRHTPQNHTQQYPPESPQRPHTQNPNLIQQRPQFPDYVSYHSPTQYTTPKPTSRHHHHPHHSPRRPVPAMPPSDHHTPSHHPTSTHPVPPEHPTILHRSPAPSRLYIRPDRVQQSRAPRPRDEPFSPPAPRGVRSRKRERPGRPSGLRRVAVPPISSQRDDRFSQYEQGFRAASFHRDEGRLERRDRPRDPAIATLRVDKGSKEARMRKKGDVIVTGRTSQASNQVWSRDKDDLRRKKRFKADPSVNRPTLHDRPSGKRQKSNSTFSADDASLATADPEKNQVTAGTQIPRITSRHDNDLVRLEDDSGPASERDAVSTHSALVSRRREERRRKVVMRRKMIARAADPDEPYPQTLQCFSGIPATSIGEMLQLWEFVNAFPKTLRLSAFSLRHLEQAIVHKERSTLLDAVLTRLVRSILADRELVTELGVPDSVVKSLTTKGTKNVSALILASLPDFLSFEADEQDEDYFLNSTLQQLSKSSDKWAFYTLLQPAAKLRILRELVDYAAMTDVVRECIADSMEHVEEEKKKAKEENAANRKKLELQLRELKAELLDFRVKNGLIEPPSPDSDKEKGSPAQQTDAPKEPPRAASTTDSGTQSEREELLSRKDKLLAAQRERKEEEQRRVKEKEADAIVAKIEKLRTQLKSLKNIRLRNRSGGRDGDLFDGSVASPVMPFTAPHEDPVRTHPIGTDREDRCYWFFEDSGRIWIEDTKTNEWMFLNTEEQVERLIRWLSSYRMNEQQLKKNIKSRKEHFLMAIGNEAKSIEAAKLEAQKAQESSEPDITPRYTRAGKRKADIKAKSTKAKKKSTGTFLDYRNLEK